MELQIAANCIDKNQDGLIDYNEFMAALRPDWDKNRPLTEGEKIDDEVKKICATCACRTKFKVFQVGEGKYRVSSLVAWERHGVRGLTADCSRLRKRGCFSPG